MNPQRILISGGRGRLASLIADHFRAPHYEISLFSRNAGAGFSPLERLADRDILAGGNVLLHLAWSTLPATSERLGGQESAIDLPLLGRMIETIGALPAREKLQLVFFSSGGAIYGNAPGRPNRESDPCAPVGSYGRAKLAAETLLRRETEARGLACTILRISNPYGYPVPRDRAQGIIPHALRCAAENQPLTLWGDGSARKDFLYYTDFLSALELVIARRLTGVYNVSAGRSHRIDEVVGLVEQHTGKKISLNRIAAPAWDVHDSRLDSAKLSADSGWEPQVSLAEGIRRFAAGYATH